jgi:predicted MFS family arabinose efflux permease
VAADSRVGSTSVLFTIVTISAFDRLCIAPLLAPIAADFGVAVSTITFAATAHFLCYGMFQLCHGWMSERVGRQRALRIALTVLGLGNLACALSPGAAWLVLGRAIAGAASGGLVPGALVSIADQPPGRDRARRQAVLISALGVGTALAAVAGLGSRASEWRIVFAATAVACLALVVPVPVEEGRPATVRSRVLEVARRPGVRFVALVGIPEGAAVFGFVVFFPLAVAHLGLPPEVAALSTAAVGIGMLLGGFVVRRLTGVLADRDLTAAGAALLAVGYGIAALPAASAVFLAALLAGLGQSALHAVLQRWASEAAPDARGISAALFGLGIFGGAGLAALLGAGLPNQFATLFLVSALCAVVAGAVTSIRLSSARRLWSVSDAGAGRSTGIGLDRK